MPGPPRTIPAALSHQAAGSPQRVAVIDDTESLTYAELEARAEQVARALIAAGVDSGDRVALWAPTRR